MLKLSNEVKNIFSGLRLVYFGTGTFALPALKALLEAGIKPIVVVTSPDMKVGRDQILTPSPIKAFAVNKNLPLLQPIKLDEEFLGTFKKLQPDIVVLTDYGKIIPQKVLGVPVHGFLNIHPSLLPKYRGASPVENVILNGEIQTGVSIIVVDALLDHGPIVSKRKTKIKETDTAQTLRERLSRVGAELLIKSLPRYLTSKNNPKEQSHDDASFTTQLSREDGKISFAEDAETIERKVRAFTPWPGAYAIWKTADGEKRLKILKASVGQGIASEELSDAVEPPYGLVVKHGPEIGILTSKRILVLHNLQLEGKSPMNAKDFLNGYSQIIGNVLI
ncbi:MAG: methionyl-tRNA formyltransferase [bacterium]|nr:methionyl-tRNA formyltransferase [bacterium]